MSVTVSLYDLFSYTIPGIVYLYIINETLRLIEMPYIDINNLDNLFQAILLALLAYIVGHLFDEFNKRTWVHLFLPKNRADEALKIFIKRYPELNIQLKYHQWPLFLGVIRRQNPEIEDRLSYHNALGKMLRNISFGLFLFSILQIVLFIIDYNMYQYILLAFFALGFSFIALQRGLKFSQWFYLGIYEYILSYGTDIWKILKLPPPPTLPDPPAPPTPSKDQSQSDLAVISISPQKSS